MSVLEKRRVTAAQIRQAYLDAETSLRDVGRLLRTTDAGKYLWAVQHKTVVSGLAIVLNKLAYDVPEYDDTETKTVKGGCK